MESSWRWNVVELLGPYTGFQLVARLLQNPSRYLLIKESDVQYSIRDNTGPGPDGCGTILLTQAIGPADRFPYGWGVVAGN